VPTNIEALRAFRFHVVSLWGRALRRRSQKDGTTFKAAKGSGGGGPVR
jgi:RNA-directed DNA polymerase